MNVPCSPTKKDVLFTKRTILLTGATGLIGSYLLKILLQNGHKVYVLARSKNNKSAKERVIDILKFWDERILDIIDNLIVFEGDITKKNLGLGKKEDFFKNQIEEIFHSAALIEFNWPLEKMRKINIEGTRNILDFALECHEKGKLKKVNYISTIYVCGDYGGIFKENDLGVGQKFYTTYDQSKFEAERLVEEYRKRALWIDIFRLPIVVGEHTTGKTFQFKHLYYFLHICTTGIFDKLPVFGITLNLTPVDSISEAMYTVSCYTTEKNKTYHLFGLESVSLKHILTLTANLVGFKIPKLIHKENFDIKNLTPIQKLILKSNLLSISQKIKFDSTYTNKVLFNYGFKFPRISDSILSRLIRYAADSGIIKTTTQSNTFK